MGHKAQERRLLEFEVFLLGINSSDKRSQVCGDENPSKKRSVSGHISSHGDPLIL